MDITGARWSTHGAEAVLQPTRRHRQRRLRRVLAVAPAARTPSQPPRPLPETRSCSLTLTTEEPHPTVSTSSPSGRAGIPVCAAHAVLPAGSRFPAGCGPGSRLTPAPRALACPRVPRDTARSSTAISWFSRTTEVDSLCNQSLRVSATRAWQRATFRRERSRRAEPFWRRASSFCARASFAAALRPWRGLSTFRPSDSTAKAPDPGRSPPPHRRTGAVGRGRRRRTTPGTGPPRPRSP